MGASPDVAPWLQRRGEAAGREIWLRSWGQESPEQVPVVPREGRAGGLQRFPSSISAPAPTHTPCQPRQLKRGAQANTEVELLIGFLAMPPPSQLRGMLALHATSPLPGLREKELG